MTYNGYANYETWNVALWLDNDQSDYANMQELTREHKDHPAQLADAIREYVEENHIPDLGATMAADLLGAAMSEVNWFELAETKLADMPEDEDEEEA